MIAFIDNKDSFTFNIVQSLERYRCPRAEAADSWSHP